MFLLLRHGETDYNLERRYQGASQSPHLTPLGRQQIKTASIILRKFDISKVFCSPLQRTQETLQILHNLLPDLPQPSVKLDALMEPSIPEWIGLLKEDIQKTDPQRLRLWRERPWEFSCRDGTFPLNLLYDRIKGFVNEFSSLQGNVLVIGHDHVNRAIILSLLGLPIYAHTLLPQQSGAMSAISSHHSDFGRSLLFSNIREYTPNQTHQSLSPKLILVRHGTTEANNLDVFQGVRLNLGLSSEGSDQVNQHIDFFKRLNPRIILSSTLRRAVETAEILALGIPIIQDQRLNEFDYGDWTGQARAEVRQLYGAEYKSWINFSGDSPVSSGESLEHFISRVQAALDNAWEQAFKHGTIVIISHEIVLRLLLVLSLRLPAEILWRFQVDHVCFTELSRNSLDQVQLRIHNFRPSDLT